MAFLFLSKKKLFEGNSSTIIGVSSSLKIHPASGVPFVNCREVIEAMGLSISLDGFYGITIVPGLLDAGDGVTLTPCGSTSSWLWTDSPDATTSGLPSSGLGIFSSCSGFPISSIFS